MRTLLTAGFALALMCAPAGAMAQEGAKLDCVPNAASATLKSSLSALIAGAGDQAARDALYGELDTIVDGCVASHAIAVEQRDDYLYYSLARIAREWLIGEIAKSGLSTATVDKAMDFGPKGANPDFAAEMTDDQIVTIVQAYTDSGVDVETIDTSVWEKVGAYAAATSIYWNKRKALPF